MATTINNYAELQALLNSLVGVNGLPIGQAPHMAFWNSLTYTEFITGNVPGNGIPGGPYKILEVGNAKASNIIMALSGTPGSPFDPNTGTIGQMPQPNPPYNADTPMQSDVIQALTDWINNSCPNNVSY
jgi:hypothetical protein